MENRNNRSNNKENKMPSMILALGIISFSAIIISITTLLTSKLEFDDQNIAIDTLLVLTTILIAWQIFNYFSFSQKVKEEIEHITAENQKQIDKTRDELKNESKKSAENGAGIALLQVACMYADSKENLYAAFSFFCNGITLLNGETELNKEALENSIPAFKSTCQELLKSFENNGQRIIDKGRLYFNAALKTGDQELIELVLKVIKHPDSSENPEQETAKPQ